MLKRFFIKKNTPGPQYWWTRPSDFQPVWKKRIELMASYLDPEEQVFDFGCGLMWLEHFLNDENRYVPIDFIKRDDRTIVCDFNRDEFPQIEGGIAFLSGILEYIQNIALFINELKKRNHKKIILSYCTTEKVKSKRERKKLHWVSHESVFILIEKFLPEYSLIHLNNSIPKNSILVFQKKVK